jgi:serine/threonine protein kinase
MSEIACLRCKEPIDSQVDTCPHCGEKVTGFQRTYSSRLLDGKYQILDRLGLGGMGEIFKVRHIHLNELRVIKIMRANVATDEQGLQRFLQEARTSTMIKHKNLAMLYDFSTLEDGSYYMVWEFIDGTNIQKWIGTNGPIPPRLAIEMSVQALAGLEHLHSMGLIHRDISPENIMLSQDYQGKLLVKVIDFGIAKQLSEGESGQGLTQTGMFLGKLKYASPEQAGFIKEGEHLDPRSDLYSFGIVMYEMLAGRAPFQATNPHGYILKHVTEKPIPIVEMNPAVKVPPKLEAILMKSLEKNRDARFATAGEMATALESIRGEIAPDQKYGLGEKMITLSGAQTLVDAAKPTRTGSGTMAGSTMGGTLGASTLSGAAPTVVEQKGGAQLKTGPTGTRIGSDEATVMERIGGAQPKTGPTGTRIGSDEATVMERIGGAEAQPTVVERKGGWEQQPAEATVIEAKYQPGAAPKSKAPMIGIAAAVVVALIAGGIYITRSKPAAQPGAVPAGQVTASGQAGAVPAGQGVLLLSASPYGELKTIIDERGRLVDLTEDKLSTPTRIDLEPGKYTITLVGPNNTSDVFNVEVKAGERKTEHRQLGNVDLGEIEKDMGNPQ